MNQARNRGWTPFVLVFGAMIFGMVLAGGLDLTVPSESTPQQVTPPPASNPAGFPSFADLAEAVEPAVVTVVSSKIETVQGRQGRQDPFEFFFGPRRQRPEREGEEGREFRSDSGGSGFIIDPSGLIVTNFHVIEGATKVEVLVGDREYEAEVIGSDEATDLALLKADVEGDLPYLALADGGALRDGDWVMAIGNPLALGKTVTVGVVSAQGRSIGITADSSLENFIQTDAAINRGNSGGPLVNLAGEVVGIATAMNWGAENIGFAVPVSTLKSVLPQLRDKGHVSRGYLGIRVRNLDHARMKAFGLDSTDGALVASVDPDTPAEKGGLMHGDVILEVDGHKVVGNRDLIDYVSAQGPDAEVELLLVRNGKRMTKTVELGERPGVEGEDEAEEEEEESGVEWLGVQFQDISDQIRSSHGIPEEIDGVWVTEVSPSSALYDEQVRPGDVLSEVNGQPVGSVREFEEVVSGADSGSYLRLYVNRHDARSGRVAAFFAIVQVP